MESARHAGHSDLEFVVCSPHHFEGPDVVWVRDPLCFDSNIAWRMAYNASSGEAIIGVPDDHVFLPGRLAQALAEFDQHPQDLWHLYSDWTPRIFGKLFAAFPLCRRELVELCKVHFYPYIGHFGDPAFSLGVWRAGRCVRQTSVQVLDHLWRDRQGQPVSDHKANREHYEFGKFRIYDDFPEFSRGWEDRPDFNS